MKAIILAAGLGTRLKELGEETPKCLMETKDKTLLETQVEILNNQRIEDIMIVIGEEGNCWTNKNQEKIQKIIEKTIINKENDKTKNTHSLKLALNKINEAEDLLVIDGDLAFSEDLIKKIINNSENLVLSKQSLKKEDPSNRILISSSGKIQNIKRNLSSDLIYGALIKIKKESFKLFKDLVNKEKYYGLDLGFLLDDFINKMGVYNFTHSDWINVNTVEDLRKINNLINKNFVALMFGYTAVGKSTIAQKIAKIPNTEIFHSAFVRKELDLTPKNTEDADKFFDYRNNLRKEVDEQVYRKLAENLEKALKNKKNVVLDAGYFFNWQRKLIYDKLKSSDADFFVIKVQCEDEEEIKRRLKERQERFSDSPLNETPSWNAYISSKKITEPLEKDNFLGINIIEYDSLTGKIKKNIGRDSINLKKIMGAIKL